MAEHTGEKKGDLLVIAIDVESGKISKVKGIEKQKVGEMYTQLDKLGFEAPKENDYAVLKDRLSRPSDSPVFILHTHSSPGCSWVFQDGWWRYVCNG